MFAGSIAVGLEIGGLQAFFSGWQGATALVFQSTRSMLSYVGQVTDAQIEAGDQIQKMAQRVDWATESLSTMDLALDLAGTSLGEFEIGMRGAIRVVDNAKDGLSGATRTLDKMGLSLKDLEGLNSEQIFFKMAEGLQNISDKSARAAVAQEAFGKSGQALMPLLNSNIEGARELAKQMGNVWTQDQADLAARVKDGYTLVETATRGLGKAIALQLMPYVAKFLEGSALLIPQLTEWVNKTGFVGQAVKWMGEQWRAFWTNLNEIGKSMGNLITKMVDGFVGLGTKVGTLMGEIGNGISIALAEIQVMAVERMNAIVQGITSHLPTSGASGWLLSKMGLDAKGIADMQNGYSAWLGESKQFLKDIETSAVEQQDEIEKRGERLKEKIGTYVNDIAQKVPEFVSYTSELVLQATDTFEGVVAKANDTFSGLLGSFNQGAEKNETEAGKSTKKMGKHYDQFFKGAAAGFADMAKGAGSSFGEVVGSMLESVGMMAVKEGLYHILAGTAMLATPGLRSKGKQRIASGTKLAAYGAAAAATGAAFSGGGGDSGEGSSGDSGTSSFNPGTDTGVEVNEENNPRPSLTINSHGPILDGRGLLQHLSELRREFADYDIELNDLPGVA